MTLEWVTELAEDLRLQTVGKRIGTDGYQGISPLDANKQIVFHPLDLKPNLKKLIKTYYAHRNIWWWQGLNNGQHLLGDSVRVASLNAFRLSFQGGVRLIAVTTMPGDSLHNLYTSQALTTEHIRRLASFVYKIESLPDVNSPISLQNKRLSYADWQAKFSANLDKFATNVLSLSAGLPLAEEVRVLVHELQDIAKQYAAEVVGYGGLHGRPRLGYYSWHEGVLYVDLWEVASSSYIRYYELASRVCNFLGWLGSLDGINKATEVTQEYASLLGRGELAHFRMCYMPVFAQRMLGDLWDIMGRKTTRDGVIVDIGLTLKGIRQYMADTQNLKLADKN